jgi:hypothetical protein
MAASLLAAPVGVASWLGPASAAGVFAAGALADACDWGALGRQATHPVLGPLLDAHLVEMEARLPPAPHADVPPRPPPPPPAAAAAGAPPSAAYATALARHQVARFLRLTDVTNFRAPTRPDAAVFTLAGADQYVPADAASAAMWAHVAREWTGADVRRVRGGHVSASIFALDSYVGTVLEVTRRLLLRQPGAAAGTREGAGAAAVGEAQVSHPPRPPPARRPE